MILMLIWLNNMEWVRRIGCFFGFHRYVALKESWFLFRKKDLYLENQDYLKHGENIVNTYICLYCNKKREVKVNQ